MSQRIERYLPGRPLPERAFLPGHGPRPPEPEGTPRDLPPADWHLDEAYLYGADLYNAGFPWEAHEAWEGIWRVAGDPDRKLFLQGLIQCAAAVVKAASGSPGGARRLAARGTRLLDRVASRAGSAFMGLDLEEFLRSFRAWADQHPDDPAGRPLLRLEGPDERG